MLFLNGIIGQSEGNERQAFSSVEPRFIRCRELRRRDLRCSHNKLSIAIVSSSIAEGPESAQRWEGQDRLSRDYPR